MHNVMIWSHVIHKSQCVHYKIVWSYVTYDMSYKIKLLSIPYNMTKSYATKLQHVSCPLDTSTVHVHNYTHKHSHMNVKKFTTSQLMFSPHSEVFFINRMT